MKAELKPYSGPKKCGYIWREKLKNSTNITCSNFANAQWYFEGLTNNYYCKDCLKFALENDLEPEIKTVIKKFLGLPTIDMEPVDIRELFNA